jgi:LacI family transcriptional regulator
MNTPPTFKVLLLFRHEYAYGRDVIAGIASYLRSSRASWNIFLSNDFGGTIPDIDSLQCHGVIADFDDPEYRELTLHSKLPLVAIGSSYRDETKYPVGITYVATDNEQLIHTAYRHLIDVGLSSFAMMSLPLWMTRQWADERENYFMQLTEKEGLPSRVFRSALPRSASWEELHHEIITWVKSLPKPVGIVAASDGFGRQLLQACAMAGICVPDEVAVVGIDNDALGRTLNRISLSSVIQGTAQMGQVAAQLLHKQLTGLTLPERIVVPPEGVNVLASSKFEGTHTPLVMRARHFIRQHACQGIKVQQVVDYLGVSRTTLEASFRNELGRSVHEDILRFKLDSARSYLANSNYTLAEIALHCGLGTAPYMSNVFKREFGCTPRTYQASHQLESKERSSR